MLLVLKRIYRIFGYSFVNVFVRLQMNIPIFIGKLISTNNHCQRSHDHLHAACMMASDASSSPKKIYSRNVVDLDRMCGSIFEGINAVLRAFCATKPLSTTVGQRSATVGLQQLYCEVCLKNIRSFWGYSIRCDLK